MPKEDMHYYFYSFLAHISVIVFLIARGIQH